MATLSRKFRVYSDGSIQHEPVQPPVVGTLPRDMIFVRVLHEAELPANRRHVPPRMPEVRPMFPNHHVPFGKYWQLLSKQMNPLLTPGNWTAAYHYELWIANNQGFGMDDDPRANYITGQDLSFADPRVEALTCGGNLLRVIGEIQAKTTGIGLTACYIVETLNWRNAPPKWEDLQKKPWFITEGTKLTGDGGVTRFPQGQQSNGFMPGVRHPLIADPSRIPIIEKWRVRAWTDPNPPDPYKVYL